jgi:hypothetical protein
MIIVGVDNQYLTDCLNVHIVVEPVFVPYCSGIASKKRERKIVSLGFLKFTILD